MKKGFTLIELLIVIAILGVLAAGILVAINPFAQLGKARDSVRKTAIKQIQSALEQYLVANGSYINTNRSWIPLLGNDAVSTALINGGYLKKMPIDPISKGGTGWEGWPCEYYYNSTGGSNYDMHFCFENTSDPIAQLCDLTGDSSRRYCHPNQSKFIGENP